MKRVSTIILVLLLVLTASGLMACRGSNERDNGGGKQNGADTDGKIQVVATIFPEYDWAREIVGPDNENVEVTLLVSNGADLHSYQPTVDDIMKISSCDVFIYVGGESDSWVKDVLDRASNKDTRIVCLMDILGDEAKEEESAYGMEDYEHDGEDEDRGEEYDEHVWLSLRNACMFCEEIKNALCSVDPENSETYTKNEKEYIDELTELDLDYDRAVAEAEKNVLVFGDRFPFRYLTDDHDIKYYAAFTGCSAETEASFETIRFLAGKVDEYGLNCIMTIDGSDGKIAKTVAENTKRGNQKILMLDSMQSVTQKEIDEGKTYAGVMEKNLNVLEEALGTDK